MIKRYVLHIEAHKNRLPRISFKRAPSSGDRVVDGGVPGTLKRCPICQEGFLHEPDPRWKGSTPLPPGPHKWLGKYCVECENNAAFCPYPPAKPPMIGVILKAFLDNLSRPSSYPARPARSYHTPRPAMDFNAPRSSHVEVKFTEPKPEPKPKQKPKQKPAEHVELKLSEDVETKIEEESPETLELDYTLGMRKYKVGETVWTHKAEYVVEKLEDDVLYLVRKDVWDARKKGEHVELNFEKPAEHVELKVEEEKPAQHVVLNFDSKPE